MICKIYRSELKPVLCVVIEAETDIGSLFPKLADHQLGKLDFLKRVDIAADSKPIGLNAAEAISNIRLNGFHLIKPVIVVNSPEHDPLDENRIVLERREKLRVLRDQGSAFPNDFQREHLAADLHAQYDALDNEQLDARAIEVTIAGRMMLKRVMGKASFATLQDMSGRIQLYISNDLIGEAAHDAFKHYDRGDILGAKGTLFKTKTGELTVQVAELRLLTKALRPLPEKFHGLTDQEQKYRQRYVDLITNEATRKVFAARSKIVQGIREFLVKRGYLEVETPMMHPIPGGAAARPFVTHHNALDMRLYLRIAPELYLKRLVVGGLEKVFEINRNFRNEDISTRHNPEFTMLEFYEAYRDYRYLMDLTEAMFREVSQSLLGTTTVTYQGKELDFGSPFGRLTITAAIQKYHPQFTDASSPTSPFCAPL